MSLTSFVMEKNVREKIDDMFPKPDFDLDAKIVAPPRTGNYRLVGIAFDYILRFWLKKNYPDSSDKSWVACSGQRKLEKIAEEGKIDAKIANKAKQVLDQAKKRYEKYLETGELTKELLQSALDLARLDGAYRATRSYIDNPPKEFGSSDSRDIEDLEALFKLIPSRFLNLSNLLLNPTFGGASALVGGADADLIIGKTLIDIKTVKKFTLEVGYWRQLVGYAILADLANDASFEVIIPPFVEKAEIPNLDEVGIYFSRYGEVWAFPTSNIYEHEGYQKFKKWFVQEATKKYMVVTSWEGAMEETSWEGARMESEARRNLRSNPVEFVKNKSSFRRILEIVRDKHVRRSKLSERLGVKRSTLRKYLGDLRSAGLTKKDPSGKPKNALVKITERGEAVESKVRSEN